MIKLTLKRRYRGSQYTIGSLYINNQYFCDTLEDRDRGLSQQMSLDNIKLKKVRNFPHLFFLYMIYKINLHIHLPKDTEAMFPDYS